MKEKKYIFPAIILLSTVSGFYLTFLRYQNQNLLFEKYNFLKIGNILNNLFFVLIIGLAVLNMLKKSKYSGKTLWTLLVTSLLSFGTLFISNFISDKDYRIILSACFLFITGFQLFSLLTIALSRSKKLHIFRALGYTILLAFTGFIVNIYQIYKFSDDYDYIQKSGIKADAGVILGAAVWGGNRPSPVLRERINKGYELYEKKIVPRLVLTGGGYAGELSEAEVAKNELIRYGINENHLVVEKESNSTIEQIHFVRDNLYNRMKWNNIIIISDNFHLFRAMELCRFNKMNVFCVSTDTPLSTEGVLNFCIKESIAVLFFWFFGIG